MTQLYEFYFRRYPIPLAESDSGLLEIKRTECYKLWSSDALLSLPKG